MSQYPAAIEPVEGKMPWKLIALFLNSMLPSNDEVIQFMGSEDFPRLGKGDPHPLPNDFAQRGLLWVEKYSTGDWFTAPQLDDDERYSEVRSPMNERDIRCF
ncbi:hypothetical protein CLIM01_14122 [Colletotrichum limetticola]|uniref:Uncharacterized protein n=1 Tax=Colletotrichum limetticola TaxID=1209924 RepID=A0ABQ9P8W5_9PEZI|nr:hypothetical protein CLIM01_14122 [Colletotrichum limetticola]